MKLRFYLSLIVAKLAYIFLKVTKLSSGTAIIGLITKKICPNFLVFANNFIVKSKINITGTNGKTTSSGIISHLIKSSNYSIISNSQGANMLNGIINTLALEINPLKKVDYSVIETDEAFLKQVYEKMKGDYLLVTNLFEDQTDRFANPLFTRDLIQKGIDLRENVQLILNADEPVSSSLKSKSKSPIYFCIEHVFDEENQEIIYKNESYHCPKCSQIMNYSKTYYAQVGDYCCECGYKRPDSKYKASVTLYKHHSILNLNNITYEVPLTGLFNVYNALGAIVLCLELGIDNIQENLKTFKVAFGRSEKRKLNGHDVLIQLIKNPAGTNEVLKTVDLNSNILIVANNNVADGTDISWIEQVDFERFAEVNKEIVISGLCCNELENRLKKAGVRSIKIISDIDRAVEYIGQNADSDITVLTTYTALLKIDKIKEMKKCF